MDRPVTVVIPYNERFTPRSYLSDAVESARRQSVSTVINIVEDDNGPAYGRNHGLEDAETRFVAFLDADDIWKPNKLTRQLDALEKTGTGLSIEAPPFLSTPEIVRELLISDFGSVTSSILVDTQTVTTRFQEDLIRYEDQMFVAEAGLETEFAPVADCVITRKHDQGMSQQGTIQMNLEATIQLYERLYQTLPKSWPYRTKVLSSLGYNIARLNQRCDNYRRAGYISLQMLRRHGWNTKTAGLISLLPFLYIKRLL